MTNLRRMLVVANTDWFIANFMSPFLTAHVRAGIEVIAASPSGVHGAELSRRGIRWEQIPMSRGRGSLRDNLATIASIRRRWREAEPDVTHFVTAKAVVLGNLALIAERSPRLINVLPGLGHAFSSRGLSSAVDRRMLHWGVGRAAARPGSMTVFHQQADEARMLGRSPADRGRTRIISGWGIDLARFSPVSVRQGPPLVVMVSRMLWAKGVEDFVKAAQICRDSYSGARFVLVGDPDLGNPGPVPTQQLEVWNRIGWVEWWRHRDDIPQVLAQASILVLPSRYGEGVPQALIEAAAMAIPIVASDLPGCREVVEDGRNGILVRPGDIQALAQAVLRLARDPELRRRMGRQGREIAQQRFGVDRIVAEYVDVYKGLALESALV